MSLAIAPTEPRKPLRLLLAEDNEDDVFLIRQAFARAEVPIDMSIVGDGANAVRFLQQEPPFENAQRPQVVLMDINMPLKNGFEALAELKSDPDLCSIPIIMMTTSNREEDIALSYARGASSFITKPTTIEDLERVARYFWQYWTSIASLPHAG